MKHKPAVPNELLLEHTVFLEEDDEGQTVRIVIDYNDMVCVQVHKPVTESEKQFSMYITREDMESLITLFNEWKDENEDVVEVQGEGGSEVQPSPDEA